MRKSVPVVSIVREVNILYCLSTERGLLRQWTLERCWAGYGTCSEVTGTREAETIKRCNKGDAQAKVLHLS
jgi:hypothetical protein